MGQSPMSSPTVKAANTRKLLGYENLAHATLADSKRRQFSEGHRSVSFKRSVSIKLIPNLCDVGLDWKAKLWWQPADLSEFLRMRVLIGRAYIAVAKRRGVKVDSDFPPEPVLAHESRLGLHLGRRKRRERNRRKYVTEVLKEQDKQVNKLGNPEGRIDMTLINAKSLAKVARRASKRDATFAVEQARRHHEKTMLDIEYDEQRESVEKRPPAGVSRVSRARRMYTWTPSSPEQEDSLRSMARSAEASAWDDSEFSEVPSVMVTPELLNAAASFSPRRSPRQPSVVANAIAKALEENKQSASFGADSHSHGGDIKIVCQGPDESGSTMCDDSVDLEFGNPEEPFSPGSSGFSSGKEHERRPTPNVPPLKLGLRSEKPQSAERRASLAVGAQSLDARQGSTPDGTPIEQEWGRQNSPSVREMSQKIERQLSEHSDRDRRFSEKSEWRVPLTDSVQPASRTGHQLVSILHRASRHSPAAELSLAKSASAGDMRTAASSRRKPSGKDKVRDSGVSMLHDPPMQMSRQSSGAGSLRMSSSRSEPALRMDRVASQHVVPTLNQLDFSPRAPTPASGAVHQEPQQTPRGKRRTRDSIVEAVFGGGDENSSSSPEGAELKHFSRQRSPNNFETRGFGLPRSELERAGLSATGHLLLATPPESDNSNVGNGAELLDEEGEECVDTDTDTDAGQYSNEELQDDDSGLRDEDEDSEEEEEVEDDY